MAYFEAILEAVHENSILVFDDIHWSAEMEQAWAQISAHPRVTLSIDLFFIGVVFFRQEICSKTAGFHPILRRINKRPIQLMSKFAHDSRNT